MANAIYPEYKRNLLIGTANYNLNTQDGTIGPFCSLVTATYVYSGTHAFFSSVTGTAGTALPIGSAGNPPTVTAITTPGVGGATFDGADLVFLTVAAGPAIVGFVIYRHNGGAATTWPLVMFYDQSGGGLPVTPNGGNITLTWAAAGIFTL